MSTALNNLTNTLSSAISAGAVPGAALALVTPGHIETGYAGMRQLIPEVKPVEADTIYDMASCTKVVSTTTLILQMLGDGIIQLNTPVSSILTDFPHPEITIQHLLTHTSGLPSDDKNYRTCHNKQEMRQFINHLDLVYKPGTEVMYSDFGFILLGFIIEDKLGPLDQVAEKRIFQPLAMKDTCYCPDQHGLTDRCAATEQKEGRGVIVGSCHDGKGWILNGVSGNAGLFSTANDIGRFACIMLNEGELDGHRVLKKESVDLLKHCYTEGLNLRRTLGWFSNDPNQTDGSHISSCCIYHTGFTGTSIYIDFVRSCAIVLLTNRVHPSRNNNAIMDLRRTIHDEALIAFDQGQWQ